MKISLGVFFFTLLFGVFFFAGQAAANIYDRAGLDQPRKGWYTPYYCAYSPRFSRYNPNYNRSTGGYPTCASGYHAFPNCRWASNNRYGCYPTSECWGNGSNSVVCVSNRPMRYWDSLY